MKIKIKPDKEKAKAILELLEGRRKFVSNFDKKIFPTVVCENYYEIIKELATALFFLRGEKFIGENAHKELLKEVCSLLDFDESILVFLDDLRFRRNGSMYYGTPFDESYLENHLEKILGIIKKLDLFLEKELKDE